MALAALIAVGVAGLGGGGFALVRELTRKATSAEENAALQAEIASRWRRLRAGQIFPATVRGSNLSGVYMPARLVGIAPQASCASAVDPQVATVLRKYGCVTVLRAAYVDASGTLVVTVGVAVLRNAAAVGHAAEALTTSVAGGLRTFPLPGTVADQFGDRQRGSFDATAPRTGPYLFLSAGGYADGRAGHYASGNSDLIDLAPDLILRLETILTGHGKPCAMKDIRC